MVKNPPANAGDVASIPGSGRSPGGGNSNLLQCSCLEIPKDTGAWWSIVHRVIKSQMQIHVAYNLAIALESGKEKAWIQG